MGEWKEYISFANEILQIIALLIGSGWALFQYRKFRKHSPKLDTDHEVDIIRFEKEAVYLRIKVIVKNIGEVIVKELQGRVSICDFSKISESEVAKLNESKLPDKICVFDLNLSDFDYFPVLIEPGEKDIFYKIIRIDFIPTVVEVHSHIKNVDYRPKGRFFKKEEQTNIGWTHSTIHKIKGEKDNAKTNKKTIGIKTSK